jgi:ABC-type oligopeptide transport system substrate-binding subunit
MPSPERSARQGGFFWSRYRLCEPPGIGSGAFTCAAWVRQTDSISLTLARNDRYYGGRSRLREIDYVFYKDPGTAYSQPPHG